MPSRATTLLLAILCVGAYVTLRLALGYRSLASFLVAAPVGVAGIALAMRAFRRPDPTSG